MYACVCKFVFLWLRAARACVRLCVWMCDVRLCASVPTQAHVTSSYHHVTFVILYCVSQLAAYLLIQSFYKFHQLRFTDQAVCYLCSCLYSFFVSRLVSPIAMSDIVDVPSSPPPPSSTRSTIQGEPHDIADVAHPPSPACSSATASTIPGSPARGSTEPIVSRSRSPRCRPPPSPAEHGVATPSPQSSSSTPFFVHGVATPSPQSSSSTPFFVLRSRRTPLAQPPAPPSAANGADVQFWRSLPVVDFPVAPIAPVAPLPREERFSTVDDTPPPPPPVPELRPALVTETPSSPRADWAAERCIISNARYRRDLVVHSGFDWAAGRIVWPPSLPPFGTSIDDCLQYAVCECKRVINGRGQYYIGVTQCPWDRFWGSRYRTHHHTYRYMYILAQSTNGGIRLLETEMVDRADIGRAQPLCANIARGGGGVALSASPFIPYFLYVVVGVGL